VIGGTRCSVRIDSGIAPSPMRCVPMKRHTLVSLACLLSTCVSTPADLHQANADKVADFPAAAADLSNCVHRAMETMDSSYAHRLHGRPDKLKFFITTTRVSR
jgi:hypothetical protein